MRARPTLLLAILCLCTFLAAGCAGDTMQGTPQRLPGMILTKDDLPKVVVGESELAALADIAPEQVANWNEVDPKAELPAAQAQPANCQTFTLGQLIDGKQPDLYGLSAFHSDGAAEVDRGFELSVGAALFDSPGKAAARFEDLRSQVQACTEYQLIPPEGSPLLMQVTPLEVAGLTLPSVAIQRKAVVTPSLQAGGFGVTIAETYFLFRNTLVRAAFREVGVRTPDNTRMTQFCLALQQHLLTIG